VESWHSISSGKTIQDALVQPLNLHQKLVVGVFLFLFFFKSESACQARKRDYTSNESGAVWLSQFTRKR
jgi:hypothetical protein